MKADDDYWTQHFDPLEKPSDSGLHVEKIDGVLPLDDQLGVADPKTVPDALYDVLFAQPEAPETELTAPDGDLKDTEPVQTYAILDAAKITNLPEMLAASGLEHRCLFKGDAFDALLDVAPWLVRIEEGNAFTRNLFTRSDAPWHLWDDEVGIYVRSGASLDEMWGHFRKFTKIQDERGTWFYWRFFEPQKIKGVAATPSLAKLFKPSGGDNIHTVIAPTQHVTYVVACLTDATINTAKPTLTRDVRTMFDDQVAEEFATNFAKSLSRSAPQRMQVLGIANPAPVQQMVSEITGQLKPLGFQKRSDIGRIAACAMFYGTYFLFDPRIAPYRQQFLEAKQGLPSLKALKFEQALKASAVSHLFKESALVKTYAALDKSFAMQAVPSNWTAQMCTQQNGFADNSTVHLFAQRCAEQQQRHRLKDLFKQRAHFILSVILTPQFLDDPLQANWQKIFGLNAHAFKVQALEEIDRQIAVLRIS